MTFTRSRSGNSNDGAHVEPVFLRLDPEQAQTYRDWIANRRRLDDLLASPPPAPLPEGVAQTPWGTFIVAEAAGATRDEYQRALVEENIATSIHFLPVHKLTYYRERFAGQPPLPVII